MFWNLWCEKVKFLSPGECGSSCSETSVATSSTGSTIYLLERKLVTINGIKQLWYKFGSNTIYNCNEKSNESTLVRKWTDKHLYLGRDFERNINSNGSINSSISTIEKMNLPKSSKFVLRSNIIPSHMEERELTIGDSVKVMFFLSNKERFRGDRLRFF